MMNGKNEGSHKPIDVICQINKDGSMFPIKVRLVDEDGMYQTYAIKSYRSLSGPDKYKLPNGVIATSTIFPFECKISCFGREQVIRLTYLCDQHLWHLHE